MIETLYKWLPRIFGCHRRPDRSFYLKGRQFPICARCTGELAGIILGVLLFGFYRPKVLVLCVLLLPLIIDGSIQLTTKYESTNLRRLFTGILFGYALVTLFFLSTNYVFEYGNRIGIKYFATI